MTDPTTVADEVKATTPADEVNLMTRIIALLEKADPAAQVRVVGWLYRRFPMATGGIVAPGKAYIVGERGPEEWAP